METNKIRQRLKVLHSEEAKLNTQIGDIDKQIKVLRKWKGKIAKRVSANMRYRNKLINQL